MEQTIRSETEQNLIKQGRVTALVIAGSVFIWLIANTLGPKLGLTMRYAILADLIVLAALFWALVNCFFIWRKRQSKEG
tara:strand:- start:4202 stop:4438 length:237 start_codon:yes stop_codon:yes gene_type:complete